MAIFKKNSNNKSKRKLILKTINEKKSVVIERYKKIIPSLTKIKFYLNFEI